MTLEERIARAIDPEAWSRWDNQPSGDIKQGSARTITAARRVIDALQLAEHTEARTIATFTGTGYRLQTHTRLESPWTNWKDEEDQ